MSVTATSTCSTTRTAASGSVSMELPYPVCAMIACRKSIKGIIGLVEGGGDSEWDSQGKLL